MSISLQKGQRIDLTKDTGLTNALVGLGWDPIEQKQGGILSSLFGGGGGGASMDCDASVIMLENDKFKSKKDLIYFGNLHSACKSVQHTGDNLTGEGDGDDEQVLVDLKKVPSNINKLVFVVNIYDCVRRKQHFGLVRNAYIRVVNKNDGKELVRFNLTDDYAGKTCLVVAEIYRDGDEWKFAAIGNGTNDANLSQIVGKYK